MLPLNSTLSIKYIPWFAEVKPPLTIIKSPGAKPSVIKFSCPPAATLSNRWLDTFALILAPYPAVPPLPAVAAMVVKPPHIVWSVSTHNFGTTHLDLSWAVGSVPSSSDENIWYISLAEAVPSTVVR